IYYYGYETLIYSIWQMLLLLVLGMIMNRIVSTVIFLMVFVSMRKYTGGYHAETRMGCTFMTVVCYVTVLVMTGWLSTFYLVILLLTYDVLRIVPYIVLSTMVVTAVLIIVQMRGECR
ncbi:MAG: accessory gene regulator B family protein, partial [Lachnospiraceae bacterium]|nr:accessory gene regulator B family protein [Lachnospiraceae bacterium]